MFVVAEASREPFAFTSTVAGPPGPPGRGTLNAWLEPPFGIAIATVIDVDGCPAIAVSLTVIVATGAASGPPLLLTTTAMFCPFWVMLSDSAGCSTTTGALTENVALLLSLRYSFTALPGSTLTVTEESFETAGLSAKSTDTFPAAGRLTWNPWSACVAATPLIATSNGPL